MKRTSGRAGLFACFHNSSIAFVLPADVNLVCCYCYSLTTLMDKHCLFACCRFVLSDNWKLESSFLGSLFPIHFISFRFFSIRSDSISFNHYLKGRRLESKSRKSWKRLDNDGNNERATMMRRKNDLAIVIGMKWNWNWNRNTTHR